MVCKLARGEALPGVPRLREMFGDKVAELAAAWLKIANWYRSLMARRIPTLTGWQKLEIRKSELAAHENFVADVTRIAQSQSGCDPCPKSISR